jgi:drug/metabolite transporter (DMT)-like permease
VFAAWLVFGEAVTPGFAVAIALVVAGVALVNSRFMGPGDAATD